MGLAMPSRRIHRFGSTERHPFRGAGAAPGPRPGLTGPGSARMTALEHVQELLDELGPASDDVAVVAQNGAAEWVVGYDDQTMVELAFDDGRDVLALTMAVG